MERRLANARFTEGLKVPVEDGIFVTMVWPHEELSAKTVLRVWRQFCFCMSREVTRAHLQVVWAWGVHEVRLAVHVHGILAPFPGEGTVQIEDAYEAAGRIGHRGIIVTIQGGR